MAIVKLLGEHCKKEANPFLAEEMRASQNGGTPVDWHFKTKPNGIHTLVGDPHLENSTSLGEANASRARDALCLDDAA